MILQTGMRTDIPAFYADWFRNRLKAGFVCVRNPYHPKSVARYQLNPDVVDLIGFCTKNPAPMLQDMDVLEGYAQYWFVTITGYDRDIEPRVPERKRVIEDFSRLSAYVGLNAIGWRYDPILLNEKYSTDRHLDTFAEIASALAGTTTTVVISFIDLYEKVRRNFQMVREVPPKTQLELTAEMVRIAARYGMKVRPCGEGTYLEKVGADCSGCMTISTFEKAIGRTLIIPKSAQRGSRPECACILSGDIGAYNSCGHFCRYCYANEDPAIVQAQMKRHDPNSPLLIGQIEPDDVVYDAKQVSWVQKQLRFDWE